MKKLNFTIICNVLSIILLILFAVRIIIDYVMYNKVVYAAPFYVCVLGEAAVFVIPAIIVFALGRIIKKKKENKK